MKIAAEKPEHRASKTNCEQRTELLFVNHCNEEERSGGNRGRTSCQAVDVVEQVEGIGHPQNPDHRDDAVRPGREWRVQRNPEEHHAGR